MSIKPVAWHTEDHTDDYSATTYDESVAIRWDMKGWPVTPMYYAIPDTHRVVSVEDLKLLLSFAPGEIPKGLDPTFYFTLTQDGDARNRWSACKNSRNHQGQAMNKQELYSMIATLAIAFVLGWIVAGGL